MTLAEQGLRGVHADKSGGTGDEDFHGFDGSFSRRQAMGQSSA
jgi:hypothetical protein